MALRGACSRCDLQGAARRCEWAWQTPTWAKGMKRPPNCMSVHITSTFGPVLPRATETSCRITCTGLSWLWLPCHRQHAQVQSSVRTDESQRQHLAGGDACVVWVHVQEWEAGRAHVQQRLPLLQGQDGLLKAQQRAGGVRGTRDVWDNEQVLLKLPVGLRASCLT